MRGPFWILPTSSCLFTRVTRSSVYQRAWHPSTPLTAAAELQTLRLRSQFVSLPVTSLRRRASKRRWYRVLRVVSSTRSHCNIDTYSSTWFSMEMGSSGHSSSLSGGPGQVPNYEDWIQGVPAHKTAGQILTAHQTGREVLMDDRAVTVCGCGCTFPSSRELCQTTSAYRGRAFRRVAFGRLAHLRHRSRRVFPCLARSHMRPAPIPHSAYEDEALRAARLPVQPMLHLPSCWPAPLRFLLSLVLHSRRFVAEGVRTFRPFVSEGLDISGFVFVLTLEVTFRSCRRRLRRIACPLIGVNLTLSRPVWLLSGESCTNTFFFICTGPPDVSACGYVGEPQWMQAGWKLPARLADYPRDYLPPTAATCLGGVLQAELRYDTGFAILNRTLSAGWVRSPVGTAVNFTKEERNFLGDWQAQAGDRYARVAKLRVQNIQKAVVRTFQDSVQGDPLGESETFTHMEEFVVAKGWSEDLRTKLVQALQR